MPELTLAAIQIVSRKDLKWTQIHKGECVAKALGAFAVLIVLESPRAVLSVWALTGSV